MNMKVIMMNRIKKKMMNRMQKNERMKKMMMKMMGKNEEILTSQVLKCQVCDYVEPVPMHCTQSMHVETVEEEERLVCWMGPSCGVQDIPSHHDKQMQLVTGVNGDERSNT